MRKLPFFQLIGLLLACVPACAVTCSSGFVEVTGPVLAPDGSAFAGIMVLDPQATSTVGGNSIRRARVTVRAAGGTLDVCLAPGTYAVEDYITGQSLSYATSWLIPSSGGPYTVQAIESYAAAAPPAAFSAAPPFSFSWATGVLSAPGLAPVSTSGAYSDLTGKPTIPTVATTTNLLAGDGAGNAVAATSLNASQLTSGTLPAARLPNPTASTLGGVEALAPTTHQFLNSIGTSGVPVSARPAAADLSDGTTGTGAVVLATIPTITTPTVTTAGSAEALAVTNTSTCSAMTSYSKSGSTLKVYTGMLGSPEWNAAFNMYYDCGQHLYGGDSTVNAVWMALNAGGLFGQFAASGYGGGGDIWTSQGSKYLFNFAPTVPSTCCTAIVSSIIGSLNVNHVVSPSATVGSGPVALGNNLRINGMGYVSNSLLFGNLVPTLNDSGPYDSLDCDNNTGTICNLRFTHHGSGDTQMIFRASNGTYAVPTAATNNLNMVTMYHQAFDGTSWLNTTYSQDYVCGSVSTGITPGCKDENFMNGSGANVTTATWRAGQLKVFGVVNATSAFQVNGTPLAASATTDTTNAANITSGTLPAARLPNPTASTLGGVESLAATTHQFLTSISTSGVPAAAQPAASDISGLAASATADTTNAANITSGTLPAARLPATVAPPAGIAGSLATAYLIGTAGNIGAFGSVDGYHTCSSNISFWPAAGWFRNFGVTTQTTNGNLSLRANYVPDCTSSVIYASVVAGPAAGGAVVPPGAAAGVYFDLFGYAHQQAGGLMAVTWTKQAAAPTPATITQAAAEYVDDSGSTVTVIGSSDAGHAYTASSTNYLGLWSPKSVYATELQAALPIPSAGTISNLWVVPYATPAANVVYTARKNGINQTLTVTLASTDTPPEVLIDQTHSATVSAGDYIDIGALTGAGTQGSTFNWGMEFTSSSSHTLLGGVMGGATVGTTDTYYVLDGGAFGGTTKANYTTPMSISAGCALSNLYVVMATANSGGVTTTFTLQSNGVDTAVSGAVTGGSGTGVIALYTGIPVGVPFKNTMALHIVSTGGASGQIGGWAATCN